MPSDFTEPYYGKQLLRSSGSSALNFREMQGAQTDKDFKFKATLSLKESKESRIYLKILIRIGYGDKIKRTALLDQTQQLIKIIATL